VPKGHSRPLVIVRLPGRVQQPQVELADLYILYRTCVRGSTDGVHRAEVMNRWRSTQANDPRRMLRASYLKLHLNKYIGQKRRDDNFLLALPTPFTAPRLPWPNPRDHGASRLASHESLHKTTAVRAVRGLRHGTISVRRPFEVQRQRIEITSTNREQVPLLKDQPKHHDIPSIAVHPQSANSKVAFRVSLSSMLGNRR
jgi:hypothetical protein